MRVRSEPPVIIRTEQRPTREISDFLMKAMKPFGKKVIVIGPDLDVRWPAPAQKRQGRDSREIVVVHEFGQKAPIEMRLGSVGEG